MKKQNSTMILNFRTDLINDDLSKGLYIIERGTKQLIFLPNDLRLIINLNNQLVKDHVMAKNKAISAEANTIKQLYIQKYMHMIYKQYFYKNK